MSIPIAKQRLEILRLAMYRKHFVSSQCSKNRARAERRLSKFKLN